ncbi:MAG: hypothetical protein R3B90_05755 [Planctomycetaceae bacterium]
MTNHLAPQLPGLRALPLGDDRGWASNLLTALDHCPGDHVLYLQDDYFLQSQVDAPRLAEILAFARRQDAGYVRLAGGPDPDRAHANRLGLGSLSAGAAYRCSLQAALWRTDVLRSLLEPGETGWQMELRGTERSRTLRAPFFATRQREPVFDYYDFTGIMKGAWVPGALRLCRREGVPVDTSLRGVHSEWRFLVKRFRNLKAIRQCRGWWKQLRRAG